MENVTEPLLIVSVDSHSGPPAATYRDYLEERYLDRIDELVAEEEVYVAATTRIGSFSASQLDVIDNDGAIASGGLTGAWDFSRRVAEMDREGIAAEVVLQGHQGAQSPFFAFQNRSYPADVRQAGVRAYHRWLADVAAPASDRLILVAENTPHPDLDKVLSDIRWAADHGFRAVMFPGALVDAAVPNPPYNDAYWESFWSTCAELDLPLVLHVGIGFPQGRVFDAFQERAAVASGDYDRNAEHPTTNLMEQESAAESRFALDYSPRRAFWQMLVGGVFDRYPDLHFVPTEARADWLPATLARMDARFEQGDTPLKRRPSEYWATNGFAGASFIHRAEIETRDQIGVPTLMFGRDYPHPEGTWPNTLAWLRAAFAGATEADTRAILGENAVRCFTLDRDHLVAVARRVGPTLETVLGAAPVAPELITEFDKRGGFAKPVPTLETSVLDRIMESALTVA